MVERLYRRVQEVKRLWKNIKFKRKILTYKDKYSNGDWDKQTSSDTKI